MAEVRDILLRIRGETRQAEESAKRLNLSFTEVNQAVELLKTGFNTLESVGQKVFDTLGRAQQIEGVSRGFQTLQQQAGLLADQSLEKLRVATRGLVDDFTLMQQANQAVQLGLDASKLDIMAEAATKLGAAVGRTANEAFTDLITGVGRASPLILDNLGITIKMEEAHQRYADTLRKSVKDLTENEKAEAFRFAAMQKIEEKARSLADVQDSAAASAQRLTAQVKNASDAFAEGFSSSDALRQSLEGMNSQLKPEDFRALGEAVGGLVSVVTEAVGWIVKLGQALGNAAADVADFYRSLGSIDDRRFFGERLSFIEKEIAAYEKRKRALEEGESVWAKFAFSPNHAKYLERLYQERQNINELINAHGDLASVYLGTYRSLTDMTGAVSKSAEKTTVATEETKKLGKELEETKRQAQNFFDVFDQSRSITEMFFGKADTRELSTQVNDLFRDAEEAAKEAARKQEELQKEAYRNSVDFFEDILIGAVEGNIEDVFKNMLTRAAIKFGAELLAQMTASFSAQALFSGGLGLGGLLGGATSNIGPVANGGAYAASLGAGGAGLLGGLSLGTLAAAPLAALTAQNSLSGISSIASGGSLSLGEQAALALPTFGASFLYNPISSAFGGGKDPGQRRRDEIRKMLQERGVLDDDYMLQLFGGGSFDLGRENIGGGQQIYNLNGNGEFAGLGNLLSTLSGGGGDLPDLAAMFSNALSEAGSFNAAALTTVGIIEDLGYTVDTAKDALTEMLLDGRVSLADYNAEMNTLNILSQDTLASMDEGWQLLADTIDGKPRDSLKAFELLYGEMVDSGIQDTESMVAYIREKFGEEAAAVFQRLAEAGITQFTDFSTLSSAQIGLIINEIQNLIPALADIAKETEESASRSERSLGKIAGGIKRISQEAKAARGELNLLGQAAG